MPRHELLLFTPLTPEQVAGQLRPLVDEREFSRFSLPSGLPLEGRIGAGSLVLFRAAYFRNVLRPGLYARLVPGEAGGGTLIRGHFGPALGVRAFAGLCGGGVLLVQLLTLPLAFTRAGGLAVLTPLLFLALLALVWGLGAWLARGDPDFIRQQLVRQLGASEPG